MSDKIYKNRELSWLDFNERVLKEAEKNTTPLFEKLNFLNIFQQNLDEFTRVRIGVLFNNILKSENSENEKILLNQILTKESILSNKRDDLYKICMAAFEAYGIKQLKYSELSKEEKAIAKDFFNNAIRPFLSAQIISDNQQFPFLRNQDMYIACDLKKDSRTKIGIIPCTAPEIRRVIPLSRDGKRFILAEELINHFAEEIFKKYEIKDSAPIRIIRSADMDIDAELEKQSDYRTAMATALNARKRLKPLQLEIDGSLSKSFINTLCKKINIPEKNIIIHSSLSGNASFISHIKDITRDSKELFYKSQPPKQSSSFDTSLPLIPQIESSDKLLSFPYESYDPFISLLNEAALSPDVNSIKMTLYRLADNSKVVDALIKAARAGKEVTVVVELRARFDEEANILWSRELEEAGCKVIYGIKNTKVHSKICSIKKNDGSYITQIGTGNYNENTSKIYTDYSLITANENIGSEINEVFDHLANGTTIKNTEYLLVSPNCLQNKIIQLIDNEINRQIVSGNGQIRIKINSLTDPVLIDKLVEAGKKGVKIDLLVRGICCLNAGIEGETDNIHIKSTVGRYLEHSRLYAFGPDDNQSLYISSADFMTRNTTRRVEVATPIYDASIKQKILGDFDLLWNDSINTRTQNAGEYEQIESEEIVNAHESIYER